MRHRGFGETLDGHAADATMDAISGCLMLVTREVFEAVGLFDEDYFFSFEDLDLCLRARGAGFDSVLVGAASAYHEGARSVGSDSLDRLYYAARNHLLLARRTASGANRLQAFGRAISILGLNVAYAVKFRGGSLPSRCRRSRVVRFHSGPIRAEIGTDAMDRPQGFIIALKTGRPR